MQETLINTQARMRKNFAVTLAKKGKDYTKGYIEK